jgi:Histone methylation protein DOT1
MPKKRTADDGGESHGITVIAPTPSKIPRNDNAFETPKRRHAAPSHHDGAVIPESDVATSNENAGNANDYDTPPTMTATRLPSRQHTLNIPHARRAILQRASPAASVPPPVTPAHASTKTAATVTPSSDISNKKPAAKRRLIFGKMVEEISIKSTTKRVYNLVKKLTGSLGGNGSCGPIYGELTQGSMQKMVNLMQQYTCFDQTSRFIDVGSGIGKPSLHVAQDPGVALSCGIEMELDRWRLSLKSLQAMLQEAHKDANDASIPEGDKIRHHCMFLHGNIMEAKTFDPFTHVYMFSIG